MEGSEDKEGQVKQIIDVPEVCATSEAARARRLPPKGPNRIHTVGNKLNDNSNQAGGKKK